MLLEKGQFSNGERSGGKQMRNNNIWPRIIQKIFNFNLQFFSKQFVGFFFYRFGEKKRIHFMGKNANIFKKLGLNCNTVKIKD